MPIRQGDIYWLDDCPDLDGQKNKRRPVVVLSPPEQLKATAKVILVVACSASVFESEKDRIALPNTSETPQAKTGLKRPCWVVPRWFVVVDRDRLGKPVGYINGSMLRKVLTAVEARISSTP